MKRGYGHGGAQTRTLSIFRGCIGHSKRLWGPYKYARERAGPLGAILKSAKSRSKRPITLPTKPFDHR